MKTEAEIRQLLACEETKCQQCLDDMNRYDGNNYQKYYHADSYYRHLNVRIQLLKQILQ